MKLAYTVAIGRDFGEEGLVHSQYTQSFAN